MANRLKSLHQRALQKMESFLDTPKFFYRNGKYHCTPTTEKRGNMMEVGGEMVEVVLSLLVRKDALPDAVTVDDTEVSVDWNAPDVLTSDASSNPPAKSPFAGRRVGRQNKLYRIISVREDS